MRPTKFKEKFRFHITPLAPYNFGLTMKKPAGWSLFNADEIYDRETLWTATRILGMLVGLKFHSIGTMEKPRILVTVFTAHPVPDRERRLTKKALETLIGADQDLEEFYQLAENDDILKHTVKNLYGMHDTQTAYLFNSVVLSICLQMAKLDRSEKMMAAVNRVYGDRVEFDGKEIVVEPAAERISGLKPSEFAKRCNLGYRAKYIIGAAKMIANGFPDTAQIMGMPPDEAKEKLMELPGVGDYAADIINPHGGFPIDAWSVDVFGKLFFGEEPENAREAIDAVKREGLRRWGKFAWLAFFYVAQDLANLSKRLGIPLRMQ
jgi:3-methyladenine DNA glycosylase/8-oxoguanine DNA glycosylase